MFRSDRFFRALVGGLIGAMAVTSVYHTINPPVIEVEVTPEMIVYPDDSDDWAETAHALGIHPDSLSVEEFIEHDSLSSIKEVQEYMHSLKD